MAARSVAARAASGRTQLGRRAGGGGDHDARRPRRRRPRRAGRRQPDPDRSRLVARAPGRGEPVRLGVVADGFGQRAHPATRGEEHGGGGVGHGAPLRPAGLDERRRAAADGSVELRHRGGQAQPVDVSPALMPPTSGSTRRSTTSSPNRARSSGADGHVLGRGDEGRVEVAPRPAEPCGGDDAGAGQRVEVGGHAEHQALGQRAQGAAAPHVGAPDGRGDELAVEAQLAAQLDALGHPGEEGVGRLVEHAAVERGRAELAADPVGLDQRRPRRRPRGAGPTPRPAR